MTEKDKAIHFCIGMLEGLSAPNLGNPSETISLGIKGIRELVALQDTLQEKPVSEGLEKTIDDYLATYFGGEKEKQYWPFLKKMAMHFAAWQKQKDAEAINENALLYNARLEGIEIGKAEIKQQMMKDAVECKIAVAYDNNYGGYTQLVDSKIPLATFGYKVKLIIIKED